MNPWGGPSEGRVNTRLVELILSAASVGAQVARITPDEEEQSIRAAKAWNLFAKAESMILSEMGRGRRVAAARNKAAAELDETYLPDDEEDEDIFGVTGDFDPANPV